MKIVLSFEPRTQTNSSSTFTSGVSRFALEREDTYYNQKNAKLQPSPSLLLKLNTVPVQYIGALDIYSVELHNNVCYTTLYYCMLYNIVCHTKLSERKRGGGGGRDGGGEGSEHESVNTMRMCVSGNQKCDTREFLTRIANFEMRLHALSSVICIIILLLLPY